MDILRFSRDHDLRTTVVIPPVFQANYDAVCSLAMELLNAKEGTVDEVTVNDWGMASVISELTSVKLNAGRLLQKDNRDPRYADFLMPLMLAAVFQISTLIFSRPGHYWC